MAPSVLLPRETKKCTALSGLAGKRCTQAAKRPRKALSGAALQREVAQSRQTLRSQFHFPVDFFCYPSGRYDAESITAVRQAAEAVRVLHSDSLQGVYLVLGGPQA